VCFLLCFSATYIPLIWWGKNLNEINASNQSAISFGAGIYAFSSAICGIKTTFAMLMNKTTLQRFVESLLCEQQRWVDRCL
jgi:hypothetical protein